MNRHDDLKDYLYPEWAGNYIMKNKSCRKPTADDSNSSDDDDDDHKRPVSYEDNKGHVLRKRNKSAVTRWKLYMPSGELQEKYHMQKFVLDVPFACDVSCCLLKIHPTLN